MARERIRFGVDLDRKTDGDFQEIARAEQRSKRNMHAVLIQRIVRLWKENPEQLRQLRLVQQ
jgi:mevalonate pyrophosphate decarboxylase